MFPSVQREGSSGATQTGAEFSSGHLEGADSGPAHAEMRNFLSGTSRFHEGLARVIRQPALSEREG